MILVYFHGCEEDVVQPMHSRCCAESQSSTSVFNDSDFKQTICGNNLFEICVIYLSNRWPRFCIAFAMHKLHSSLSASVLVLLVIREKSFVTRGRHIHRLVFEIVPEHAFVSIAFSNDKTRVSIFLLHVTHTLFAPQFFSRIWAQVFGKMGGQDGLGQMWWSMIW